MNIYKRGVDTQNPSVKLRTKTTSKIEDSLELFPIQLDTVIGEVMVRIAGPVDKIISLGPI